jgi:membrane protease YdiL (CAAX protease family)
MLLGLFGGGLIFGSLISVLLVKLLTGAPLMEVGVALSDPKNVQISRFVQAVGAFFMLGLPAIIFGIIVNKKPFNYLGFSTQFNYKQLLIVLLLLLASFFVVGSLAEVNQAIPISKNLQVTFKKLEDEYSKQVLALAQMNSAADYLLSLIILALLPAIFEEMFFRGAFQQVMISLTMNIFIGIFITSIFFSAIHLSYYAFLPRVFLGILLGYIFYYSKNIWLSIFLHFCNNAFVITQMYILSKAGKLNADALNETFPIYYGLLGIIAVFALFVVYKKECNRYIASKAVAEEEKIFNIH